MRFALSLHFIPSRLLKQYFTYTNIVLGIKGALLEIQKNDKF